MGIIQNPMMNQINSDSAQQEVLSKQDVGQLNNGMQVSLLAITSNAEQLIEYAGKVCYKSYDNIGANTKETFIRKIIERQHFSVLEHASASFKVEGVSRALLAQISRHRHISLSVESQRYVNQKNNGTCIPVAILENKEASADREGGET